MMLGLSTEFRQHQSSEHKLLLKKTNFEVNEFLGSHRDSDGDLILLGIYALFLGVCIWCRPTLFYSRTHCLGLQDLGPLDSEDGGSV